MPKFKENDIFTYQGQDYTYKQFVDDGWSDEQISQHTIPKVEEKVDTFEAYEYNGETYSRESFLQDGWTQEQIDKHTKPVQITIQDPQIDPEPISQEQGLEQEKEQKSYGAMDYLRAFGGQLFGGTAGMLNALGGNKKPASKYQSNAHSFVNSLVKTGATSTLKAIAVGGHKIDRAFGSDKALEDMATWKYATAIENLTEEMFPEDPEFQDDFSTKLASGAGSIAAFAMGGLAGAPIKIGTKGIKSLAVQSAKATGARKLGAMAAKQIPKDVALRGGTVLMGSSSTAVDEYERAIQEGATEDQAFDTFMKNFLIAGPSEALPIGIFFKRLDKLGGKELGLRKTIIGALSGGLEEGTQEIGQQLASNWIAQGSYDSARSTIEGLSEGGAVGFTLGMVLNGMGLSAKRILNDKSSPKEQRDVAQQINDYIEHKLRELQGKEEYIVYNNYNDAELASLQDQKVDLEQEMFENENLSSKEKSAIAKKIAALDSRIDTRKQEYLDDVGNRVGEVNQEARAQEIAEALEDGNLSEKAKKSLQQELDLIQEQKAGQQEYLLGDESLSKDEFIERLSDPAVTEKIKSGELDAKVVNDPDVEAELGAIETGEKIQQEEAATEQQAPDLEETQAPISKEELATMPVDDIISKMEEAGSFASVGEIGSFRPELEMPTASVNKALSDLKEGKDSAPLDQLRKKIQEFKDKGEVPMIAGRGLNKAEMGIPLEEQVGSKEVIAETVEEAQARKKAVELDERPEHLKGVPEQTVESISQVNKDVESGTYDLDEFTKVDEFRANLQNKFRRVSQLQGAIKKVGGNITDDIDVETLQDLSHGKSKQRVINVTEKLVKSGDKTKGPAIMEEMANEKADLQEVGEYFMAKHAEERNKHINAKIEEETNKKISELEEDISKAKERGNDKTVRVLQNQLDNIRAGKDKQYRLPTDGISGMTDAKAQEIKAKAEQSGKKDQYEKYFKRFQEEIVEPMRQDMLNDGLISKEEYNELKNTFENYVPMKVQELEGKRKGLGLRGFSILGRDVKKLKGSEQFDYTKRTNPLIQIYNDYMSSIKRGEQNRVNQAVFDLVSQHPNSDIFEIIKPKFKTKMNDEGNVDYVFETINPTNDPSILEFRIKGKPKFIKIKDEQLARALVNQDRQKVSELLMKVNSWLRNVNTVMNPEFVFSNFERDIQTALINASEFDIPKLKRNIIKNIVPASRGIWQYESGNRDTDWAQIYRDAKENGAEIGWSDMMGVEERVKDISKQYKLLQNDTKKAKVQNFVNSVGEIVEKANTSAEMSTRLSAYKAAIDGGMSKQQAASLAKNLTVNFNKKGNWGTLINSLYLFANAGIQGSARIFSAAKSPKVRKMMAAIASASLGLAYMNKAINEEEWEKIPEEIKARSLILMKPDGSYFSIPLPYGYNVFKYMGDVMYNTVEGKRDPLESFRDLTLATADAFNPMSSGSFSQMIAPTILDPAVQLFENKNYAGLPIMPEQQPFGHRKPEHQLYFKSVSDPSKFISKYLNEFSGGNQLKEGVISTSPEAIDHLAGYVFGGVGKTIMNTALTGYDAFNGEMDANQIPILRKHMGGLHDNRDIRIIYDMVNHSEIKEYSSTQKELLKRSIESAYKEEKITREKAQSFATEFNKGQNAVRLAEENPDFDIDEIEKMIKRGRRPINKPSMLRLELKK